MPPPLPSRHTVDAFHTRSPPSPQAAEAAAAVTGYHLPLAHAMHARRRRHKPLRLMLSAASVLHCHRRAAHKATGVNRRRRPRAVTASRRGRCRLRAPPPPLSRHNVVPPKHARHRLRKIMASITTTVIAITEMVLSHIVAVPIEPIVGQPTLPAVCTLVEHLAVFVSHFSLFIRGFQTTLGFKLETTLISS